MYSNWHYHESGTGETLVLLHGIGMSHAAWTPVIPYLAKHRRVIAFDLAGFGQSPALPDGLEPTMENLANVLRENLQRLGIQTPVHLAGNSLGGHLALVAAKRGVAKSVVALSPGGLWKAKHAPRRVHHILKLTRFSVKYLPRLSHALLGTGMGRTLALGLPMSSQASKIPSDQARQTAEIFAAARSFDSTMANATRFTGGSEIEVPVTVAFGTRDWLLSSDCQYRDQLPSQTRWLRPTAWGHVPMWDEPAAVAQLILDGST